MSIDHALHVPPYTTPVPVDLSTPVIIGHRGMGASHRDPTNPYTENTRASFIAAHAAGATWVELDLIPSADGDLMLQHDHFITINDERRPVWEFSTTELERVGIERLDGLCDVLPEDLGLYLEMKTVPGDVDPAFGPSSIPAVFDWAYRHASHRNLLLASFNPHVASQAKAAGLTAAWITDNHPTFLPAIIAAVQSGLPVAVVRGTVLNAPDMDLSVGYALAARHNIAIWSWGTDITQIARYQQAGITGFCVDAVAAAVTALDPQLINSPALRVVSGVDSAPAGSGQ